MARTQRTAVEKSRILQQNDRQRGGNTPTKRCPEKPNGIRVVAEYSVSFVLTVAVKLQSMYFPGIGRFPSPNNGTTLSLLSLRDPSLIGRPCAVLRRIKALFLSRCRLSPSPVSPAAGDPFHVFAFYADAVPENRSSVAPVLSGGKARLHR